MEQKYKDEIDLRQLFESIGNFFTNIGRGILKGIVGLRKATFTNKRIFVFTILFFIGAATAYKVLFPPVYQSSLLLKSSYLNARYLTNEIEKLNLLAKEDNINRIKKILKIDDETAEALIEFELIPYLTEEELVEIKLTEQTLNEIEDIDETLIKRIMGYLEIENRRLFQISVKLRDPSVVQDLEEGFVQFLKNDEFIKRRIEINKETLRGRKTKLLQESGRLDSLKIVLFENFQAMARQREQGSNNVILSDRYLTNPLEVFSRDLELNEKILAIDQQLYLEPEFEVVDGFTAFYKPINPGWAKSIIYAILAGIITAYIIIILISINAYLDKVEKEGV